MAKYDFKALSSRDFELLARDLLQQHLEITFESFSSGPDSGIDFRHQIDGVTVILQCKHYATAGYSPLLHTLRTKERSKVERLAPTRYVLATSVSLTPRRKDTILKILAPYCAQSSDVYGADDLNNLLARYPDVEQRHFKLWLTSTSVLRRLLNAGIFNDSELHLDRLRKRLRKYVQNPSFHRGRDLLEKFHYCIVAGIPGIGKTTLAEVLLADLVDRGRFEPFRIVNSLDEIRPVKNPLRKQVFYFDDFLGTTTLEKLKNNEDQNLIDLLEEVAANPNWRFILTTREYILNSARLRYETFAHPRADFKLCVVKLADYTRPIRARILYNHLYFSELSVAHKLAILRNQGYESILNHRNYSPRVIEYMTQVHRTSPIAPSLYLTEFNDSLEHPERIWDHAFRYQISEAARHLLLTLATLPDDLLLTDLERAFWTFYRYRQGRFGFSTRSGDWHDALKQLDGNFIRTRQVGSDILVTFHNPSVRDFVQDFLSHSDADVLDLINGSHFYEQYTALFEGKAGSRYTGVDRNKAAFLERLRANIWAPSASVIMRVNVDGAPVGYVPRSISNENRARFAVQVSEGLRDGQCLIRAVLGDLESLWKDGHGDREDLVSLLKELTGHGFARDEGAFVSAKDCLVSRLEELGDFQAIAAFKKKYPDELSAEYVGDVARQFETFAEKLIEEDWADDADWMRQVASDLEAIGEAVDIDVDRYTGPLYSKAAEIDIERDRTKPKDESDPDDTYLWDSDSLLDEGDITQLFEGLREELEG